MNQRIIRAQMAEFCRVHPFFPQSIDILCKEIGDGRFLEPVKIGCEGRGLLDSLGYHNLQSLNEQRKEILKKYTRSIEKWLKQGRPENPTESKVFSFLGQLTISKKDFLEKIISVIELEEPLISSLKKICEDKCEETCGKSILESHGRPFNCFRCEGSASPIPSCPHCCYSMILDAGLLCAGTCGEKRSMADEFQRFIEENILAYSVAINSWLEEGPSIEVMSLVTARYVTKENALEIAGRVHSSLGKKDEAKEWLAACLLKTIKDNQRWHKRTELIDNFPETTSWFKEML